MDKPERRRVWKWRIKRWIFFLILCYEYACMVFLVTFSFGNAMLLMTCAFLILLALVGTLVTYVAKSKGKVLDLMAPFRVVDAAWAFGSLAVYLAAIGAVAEMDVGIRWDLRSLPAAGLALGFILFSPLLFKWQKMAHVWQALVLPVLCWWFYLYSALALARNSFLLCGISTEDPEGDREVILCSTQEVGGDGDGWTCRCLTFNPMWTVLLFTLGCLLAFVGLHFLWENKSKEMQRRNAGGVVRRASSSASSGSTGSDEIPRVMSLFRYFLCEGPRGEMVVDEQLKARLGYYEASEPFVPSVDAMKMMREQVFDFFESKAGRVTLDLSEIGLSIFAIGDYLSWTDRYVREPFGHSNSYADVSTFIAIGLYVTMYLRMFVCRDAVRLLFDWKHLSIFFSSSLLALHIYLLVTADAKWDAFLVSFTREKAGWRTHNFLEPFFFMRIWRLLVPVHNLLKAHTHMESVNRHQIELVVAILCIIFSAAGVMFFLEFSHLSLGLQHFTDAVYFIMTTISTVGYGDFSPETTEGRMFMSLFLVVIIAVLPNQIHKIEQLRQTGKLIKKYNSSRHVREAEVVLITGHIDPEVTMPLLYEMLHPEHYHRDLQIVLFVDAGSVDDTFHAMIQDKIFDGRVSMMESLKHGSDIARAVQSDTKACFVLPNPNTNDSEQEDSSLLMRTLVLRKSCKHTIPVFVQCIRPRTKLLLEATGADFLWSQREISLCILATSCVCPGFSTMICNLIRTSSFNGSETVPWLQEYDHATSCEVYSRPFSENLVGHTFLSVAVAIHHDLETSMPGEYGGMVAPTLFGVRKPCPTCLADFIKRPTARLGEDKDGNPRWRKRCIRCTVTLNPKSSYLIEHGDIGFFVCQDEGDLEEMPTLVVKEVKPHRSRLLVSPNSTDLILEAYHTTSHHHRTYPSQRHMQAPPPEQDEPRAGGGHGGESGLKSQLGHLTLDTAHLSAHGAGVRNSPTRPTSMQNPPVSEPSSASSIDSTVSPYSRETINQWLQGKQRKFPYDARAQQLEQQLSRIRQQQQQSSLPRPLSGRSQSFAAPSTPKMSAQLGFANGREFSDLLGSQGRGLRAEDEGGGADFDGIVASTDSPRFGLSRSATMAIDPVHHRKMALESSMYRQSWLLNTQRSPSNPLPGGYGNEEEEADLGLGPAFGSAAGPMGYSNVGNGYGNGSNGSNQNGHKTLAGPGSSQLESVLEYSDSGLNESLRSNSEVEFSHGNVDLFTSNEALSSNACQLATDPHGYSVSALPQIDPDIASKFSPASPLLADVQAFPPPKDFGSPEPPPILAAHSAHASPERHAGDRSNVRGGDAGARGHVGGRGRRRKLTLKAVVKKVIMGRRTVKHIQEMAWQRRVSPEFFSVDAESPQRVFLRKRALWKEMEAEVPFDRHDHIILVSDGHDLDSFIHPIRSLEMSMRRAILVVNHEGPSSLNWVRSTEAGPMQSELYCHRIFSNVTWSTVKVSEWSNLHHLGVHRAFKIVVMPHQVEGKGVASFGGRSEHLDSSVIPVLLMIRLFIHTVREFEDLLEDKMVDIVNRSTDELSPLPGEEAPKGTSWIRRGSSKTNLSKLDRSLAGQETSFSTDMGRATRNYRLDTHGSILIAAVQDYSSMVYLDESRWRPEGISAASVSTETLKAPVFASGAACPLSMLQFLMCQAFFNTSTAELFRELLSAAASSDLADQDSSLPRHVLIPAQYIGKKYKMLFQGFARHNIIVMALYRHGCKNQAQLPYVLTNPKPDLLVDEGDKVIGLVRRGDMVEFQNEPESNLILRAAQAAAETAAAHAHRPPS